jgi:hypothetical protein
VHSYDVNKMCSYLVEPIRYRKVVVEMMGPGSNSGPGDAKPHINLTRDKELAISAAVETFEKRCDEIWKLRESLCEQVKHTRVSRGSELENMRSFVQVRAYILYASFCSLYRVLDVKFAVQGGVVVMVTPTQVACFSTVFLQMRGELCRYMGIWKHFKTH